MGVGSNFQRFNRFSSGYPLQRFQPAVQPLSTSGSAASPAVQPLAAVQPLCQRVIRLRSIFPSGSMCSGSSASGFSAVACTPAHIQRFIRSSGPSASMFPAVHPLPRAAAHPISCDSGVPAYKVIHKRLTRSSGSPDGTSGLSATYPAAHPLFRSSG